MNDKINFLKNFFQTTVGYQPGKSLNYAPFYMLYRFFVKKTGPNAQAISDNIFPFLVDLYVTLVYPPGSDKRVTKRQTSKGIFYDGLVLNVPPLQELAEQLASDQLYNTVDIIRLDYIFAKTIVSLRQVLGFDPLVIFGPERALISNDELQKIIEEFEKNGQGARIQRPNFSTSFEDLKDLEYSGKQAAQGNVSEFPDDESDDESEDDDNQDLSDEDELRQTKLNLDEARVNRLKLGARNDDAIGIKINNALSSTDLQTVQNGLSSARRSNASLSNSAAKRRLKKEKKKERKKLTKK